ncbi:hypothetical protein Tco_1370705 [Tanacetum coccineum]
MRLDKLNKFSNGTLNDVRTALDDRLKEDRQNAQVKEDNEESGKVDPYGFEDGGEDKEFQRSFRHSDTERLSQSDEVLKLKNFKKDATLKLFKSTNQERYEHVFKESHSRQDEEQAQDLKSMITTSIHKIEVYELMTKDKA